MEMYDVQKKGLTAGSCLPPHFGRRSSHLLHTSFSALHTLELESMIIHGAALPASLAVLPQLRHLTLYEVHMDEAARSVFEAVLPHLTLASFTYQYSDHDTPRNNGYTPPLPAACDTIILDNHDLDGSWWRDMGFTEQDNEHRLQLLRARLADPRLRSHKRRLELLAEDAIDCPLADILPLDCPAWSNLVNLTSLIIPWAQIDQACLDLFLDQLPHLEELRVWSVWNLTKSRADARCSWRDLRVTEYYCDTRFFAYMPLKGLTSLQLCHDMHEFAQFRPRHFDPTPAQEAEEVALFGQAVANIMASEGARQLLNSTPQIVIDWLPASDPSSFIAALAPLRPYVQNTFSLAMDEVTIDRRVVQATGSSLSGCFTTLLLFNCDLQPCTWPAVWQHLPALQLLCIGKGCTGAVGMEAVVAFCAQAPRYLDLAMGCWSQEQVQQAVQQLTEAATTAESGAPSSTATASEPATEQTRVAVQQVAAPGTSPTTNPEMQLIGLPPAMDVAGSASLHIALGVSAAQSGASAVKGPLVVPRYLERIRRSLPQNRLAPSAPP